MKDSVYASADPQTRTRYLKLLSNVGSVSRLLIRFMAVLIPIVFVACGLTKGGWLAAFLFALSVAVGLTPEMLENRSLYRVLSSRYGFKATTAEETFEPVLLRPMEAQLLGVESHTLGLLIERISYEGNRPAEISKSVSPSSKFKPHVILNR